jgi:hypothetical protein
MVQGAAATDTRVGPPDGRSSRGAVADRRASHAVTPPSDSWRVRLRVVPAAIIAMAVLLGAGSVIGARHNQTPFGRPLGEDFALFYNAGRTLDAGGSARLYDYRYEDQQYHQLFPTLPPQTTLPDLYPPVVGEAFRPVARLPYATAFGVWLVLGLALYLVGVCLLISSLGIPRGDRFTIGLLAVSFEPFIFETWLGGQIGSVAFAAVSAAFYLDRHERPVAAGLALGVCAYKPTLLLYAIPLLLLSRSWRVLGGLVLSCGGLAAASFISVGWAANRSYVRALMNQASNTTGKGTISLRLWKFVDLNSFLRLLFGESKIITLVVVIAVVGCIAAVWSSWRLAGRPEDRRAIVWAVAITATIVVNLYMGVYDGLLLAGAFVILSGVQRRVGSDQEFYRLATAVYVAPVISEVSARFLHVQVLTAVLVLVLVYSLRLLRYGERPGERDIQRAIASASTHGQ